MAAEAVVTRFLGCAMRQIFSQDAALIEKGTYGFEEADSVLIPIGAVLARIPLEGGYRHGSSVA